MWVNMRLLSGLLPARRDCNEMTFRCDRNVGGVDALQTDV
jgi:hypothetical protein